ncbi:STAS domain-containing protein [Actinoplanes teichomyceticus]|uniref:Anti-sigma factor antagonist n=1 Tax=Actinoplanes teichomyceticus TaxID=1867 RepID=A0A561VIP6_ACTTI|nr:STAS domain-containing protein [Actinoplanes teichomyceticus]TWG11491.1 anti-anti-sigma factor [Actinoplanes teichomyceticus]GIF15695.1 anti-sigma factor antagonist [Actinoplanes teichomyceticus]
MNITAHADGDGITRLALAGDLDMATAERLDEQVGLSVTETRPSRLVIDATGLTFCDSSGIHALVRARDTAHRHGSAFVLTNLTGMARRTLEITGLLGPLTTVSGGDAGF